MAKDAELDRLKAAQDRAFDRKQRAYDAQQRAWEKRSSTRDAMNRAFEAKQRAYDTQSSAWSDLERIRSSNGPQIDRLNSLQESAFENMKRAFDNASSAHDRRDGAGAASYAADGHRYKAESQGYVSERRGLVAEIRSAADRLKACKPDTQRAKDEFSSRKRAFDTAKTEHERAQDEFKRAKAEFDAAAKAFKSRLEKVKAEGQKRRDDKKSIAEKAGVPYAYRDNVHTSKDSNGNINIYFGGVGEPNGPGHGHYVMDSRGNLTYKRDPFDPHGSQNFTGNQSDYFDAVRTEAAGGGDEFGFRCMYKGLPAFVETGYDSRTGRQKINIYYGATDGMIGPKHGHAVAYRDDPHTIIHDRSPR